MYKMKRSPGDSSTSMDGSDGVVSGRQPRIPFRDSSRRRVHSTWGNFYLPSVEQVETNGLTFFVYEAQGLEQLTLETVRQFNLPEDLRGAQVDFFWAIGAPSPFPFMVDPTHRNVPLIHVVYAGANLGANQRPVFMKLLQNVTVPGVVFKAPQNPLKPKGRRSDKVLRGKRAPEFKAAPKEL